MATVGGATRLPLRLLSGRQRPGQSGPSSRHHDSQDHSPSLATRIGHLVVVVASFRQSSSRLGHSSLQSLRPCRPSQTRMFHSKSCIWGVRMYHMSHMKCPIWNIWKCIFAYKLNTGYIWKCTFSYKLHTDTYSLHTVYIQITYQLHTDYIQVTYRLHANYVWSI